MTKTEKKRLATIAWYSLALFAVIVDRILKHLALNGFQVGDNDILVFDLFKNTGIAFSLPLPPAIFWPVALFIYIALAAFYVRVYRTDKLRAGIVFTVLLGATSNLLDRAMYGWTTDYLIFFQRSAVNIADGMILLALVVLTLRAGSPRDVEER